MCNNYAFCRNSSGTVSESKKIAYSEHVYEPKSDFFAKIKIHLVIFGIFAVAILGIALIFQPWINTTHNSDLHSEPTPTPPKTMKVPYRGSIGFIGDIMLARSIGQKILSGQDPFTHVHQHLQSYDLRVGVIETTIAQPNLSPSAPGKLYTFNAPLESIPLLKQVQINVANLANNHTMDFGPLSLTDMLNRFKQNSINVVGASNNADQAFSPLITELPLQGDTGQHPTTTIKIAFLAFNDIETNFTAASDTRPGSAYFDQEKLSLGIQEAGEHADIIIAMPHWGIEYQQQPSERQRQIGHWLIDNGVDLVVGSHPHVTQPTEKYKDRYIIYSLGNFIFDLMDGAEIGQIAKVDISATITVNQDQIIEVSDPILHAPISIPTKIDADGFATIQ